MLLLACQGGGVVLFEGGAEGAQQCQEFGGDVVVEVAQQGLNPTLYTAMDVQRLQEDSNPVLLPQPAINGFTTAKFDLSADREVTAAAIKTAIERAGATSGLSG